MFDFTLAARAPGPIPDGVDGNAAFTLSGARDDACVRVEQADYAFFLWGDLHVYGVEAVAPTQLAEGIYRGTITVKDYYGAFFWLLLDKRAGVATLLGDPFGQCPVCWLRTAAGGWRFISPTRLSQAGNLGCAIRDDFLAHVLQTGVPTADGTALEGINMLAPGHRYRLDAAQQLKADDIMDQVQESVRFASPHDALSFAIADKVRRHDDIVIELSGGVESASLAAILSRYRRHKRIRCVTYYDACCHASNEVAQARAVADFFGLTHEAIDLGTILPFTPLRQNLPLHLRPSVYSCQYEQLRAIAARYGDDVLVMCGHGGDALFLAPPPPRLILDALLQSGLKPALRVWYSVSLQRRQPLLATLVQAFGGAELHPRRAGDGYARSERQSWHPARRQQWQELRWTVLEVVPLLNARYSGKHSCYPFLTAPVVMHALRAPLAQLVHGEYNRFSLRKSVYLNTLCRALWRTDKGDTTHNMLAGLEQHWRSVADFLLDGELAARGLLQPQTVMNDLKALQRGADSALPTVVRLYAAEAMVRTLR